MHKIKGASPLSGEGVVPKPADEVAPPGDEGAAREGPRGRLRQEAHHHLLLLHAEAGAEASFPAILSRARLRLPVRQRPQQRRPRHVRGGSSTPPASRSTSTCRRDAAELRDEAE